MEKYCNYIVSFTDSFIGHLQRPWSRGFVPEYTNRKPPIIIKITVKKPKVIIKHTESRL